LCLEGTTVHALYNINMVHGDYYMCTHLHYSWLEGVQYYRDCNTFDRILYDAFVATALFESRSLMHHINVLEEAHVTLSSSL